MSTRKIRKALEALSTFTGAEGDPMTLLSEPAMRELEAIERAAPIAVMAFTGDIHVATSAQIDDCVQTLESIAKEAP